MNNNNSNNHGEVAESTPPFRSVMMGQMAPPPMPRSFAMQEKVQAQQIRMPTAPLSHDAPSWRVSEPPALPAVYPLERTNVHVDCSSQEVADRICNCLRVESIAATFSDEDKVRLWKRYDISRTIKGFESDFEFFYYRASSMQRQTNV
jgi:hypothetical protein